MKGKRPRRKVIFFLVEGFSDQTALRPTLSILYDSIDPDYELFFPPMTEDNIQHGGDITSKNGITPSTMEKCLCKLYFKPFLSENKLYPKDISEIIHIVDMDGAYINDSNITNDIYKDRPYYDKENIITNNITSIIERNQRKRSNIDFLYSQDKIKVESKSIPYSIYFFSSNLDHYLHDNANIETGQEKVDKASVYADTYANKPEEFINSINSIPGVLKDMSYEESWNYIRERGPHSLERHTNINLLFDKLIEGKDNSTT